MAATASSFGISLGLYAAWTCLMFFIFCVLRKTQYFAKLYCSKRYLSAQDQEIRPRPLRRSFFAWVMPTIKASEDEVILVSGVDAAMYLRIMRYGLWFFGLTSLWVLIVVLPVNTVGKEVSILAPSAPAATYSTLSKLTMSNIQPSSSRLWLHAVSTWVVSLIAYSLLRRFSRDAVALRLKHLGLARRGAETHSIVVMDIPGIQAGSLLSRIDSLLFFLPNGLKNKVKDKMRKGEQMALRRAEGLRANMSRGKGDDFTAASLAGIKEGTGTTDKEPPEYTILGEPQGPSLNPARPPRFVPVTELDAVSGAVIEMRDDNELPEQMITREYRELYDEQVQSVHPVYAPKQMSKLCTEYAKLRIKLIDRCDVYEKKLRNNKKLKRKSTRVVGLKYGEWGRKQYGSKPVKVDMIEWYTARLEELRRQIIAEAQPDKRLVTSTAFVTFRTRQAQMVASSSMQHHDLRTWHTTTAPNPDTMIWSNLGMRAWEREMRTGIIWAAFVALTLFYLIPVGAVQALVEVDRLNSIPGFKQLLQITFIRSLLQSVFPSLVLRIFLLILPWLLRLMTKQEGVIDEAVLDARVSSKYFIFQVVTVFIGSFITGSFFSQFTTWIKNPASAVTILGTAAPLQSIFFLSYVALNALFSAPLGFINPVKLIKYILTSGLAGTERKRYRIWANQASKYGTNVPAQTITILLGTVFSVINPLLPPMAFVYFLIVGLTSKYNLLYNQRPAYASGGKMWTQIVGQITTGLVFFQLIMTALLGVRKSFSAILTAILIPLTIWVMFSCYKLFRRPMELLSVRAAVDLDEHDQEEAGAEQVDRDMYLHPGFRLDVRKHEQLMADAATMQAILDGKQELAPLALEGPGTDVNTISSVDPLGDDEPRLEEPSKGRRTSSKPEDDLLSTGEGLIPHAHRSDRENGGGSAMV